MSLLHKAAQEGLEQAVRDLLAVGADPEEADEDLGWLPIHVAACHGHVGVVQLLVEADPATATAGDNTDWTPLHVAAFNGHTAVVQLLVKAAPATLTAVDKYGKIPLDWALIKGVDGLPAARCLVQAAPTVQPTLGSLARTRAAPTFYACLVSRLALTQQEWQSIPAPCPDLVRVLPAVMERSAAEAGWLVGRLGQEQRARLQIGALCLGRMAAGVRGAPSLPAELSHRILVAALTET